MTTIIGRMDTRSTNGRLILSGFLPKGLVPVVKLGEEMTYHPEEFIPIDTIVVRMHDLLNPSGRSFRPILSQIENAGGIHKFLQFHGTITLSFIMSDKRIFGCTSEMYVHAIKILKPNQFITVDGETYENDHPRLSYLEIRRMVEGTKYIISQCPECTPIGLVKGATILQVKHHLEQLQEMKIKQFAIHTGDFISRGKKTMVLRVKEYIREIKKENVAITLYGMGSARHFRRFHRADAYVTQSHYIAAFNYWKIENGKRVKTIQEASRENIMRNLQEIHKLFSDLQHQKGGINQWVEEREENEYRMPNNATTIRTYNEAERH